MKTKARILLLLPTLLSVTTAFPATLQIATSNDMTSVGIVDPQNNSWVVQHSTNFINWSDATIVKVHNGEFYSIFGKGPENRFYRAFVKPLGSFSTVDSALNFPPVPFNYANPLLPPNFLRPPLIGQDNMPATNLTTDAGAALGRVLFYDKRLSTNQTISCSSCHQPQHGFSDPARFSLGFNGGRTGRNSMGLTQARYYPRGRFFWDERALTLEDQVLQPIQNEVEMGMTLPALVLRLQSEPFYTNLFQRAFGSTEVNADKISRSLAQFIRSIVSTQSKYDVGLRSGFTNFSASENLGRQVFLGQVGNATCVTCHGTDNFVPNNVFNNGLENPYRDKGIGDLTGRAQDEGLFKVPSLRNIELTAPYMHDGRFASLEEVVEFYNSGVTNHPNLAPQLRVPSPPGSPLGPPRRLNLTTAQKAGLVAFLKTLTDTNVVNDPKFSDPFNYGR